MIGKDLAEIINKKKLQKFSNSYFIQLIMDILSMKQQVSRNSLNEVAKTLHSIDTKLAIEFTNIFRDSFLYQDLRVCNTLDKEKDWYEENLFNYDTDKFIRQENVQDVINKVLKEHEKANKLKEHGLVPISKLLFDGNSGVGKTECAKEIAFKMNLPLYTLDLATIFDSHLGATGKKIKKVMEFAISHKCVFLLDEFDAIASARNTDKNDVGEAKRVVNILLKLLETWNHESILICATNHIEVIDSAMMRRFDAHVKFELPNDEEIKQIMDYQFRKFDLKKDSEILLLNRFKGKSHGIIINNCNALIKEVIIQDFNINETITEMCKNNS
ncbi:AAA family ATPase [Aliarcobacter butzleri]|uniref:AAA family ATPase n=1 Tax=Aliarcobacter butzleri TaxID=28197 RepID=UPI0021B46D15|nr:ATP-binding protein [Aliarcobacter butzleri]MCT7563282.1 ATP-binding protein [Aliarcobacter butzleri]